MAASCAMSLARRSQRTSGWRRTMPEAEHGASKRIASNGWPSHQVLGCAASATTISALSPKRWRFWSMRSQRLASMSNAMTWEPGSNSSSKCAVLPPGAAQASRTLMLFKPFTNNGAAHCAAGSCTDQSPSAKPGMSCTALALSNTNP